jgi:hypothetical protein
MQQTLVLPTAEYFNAPIQLTLMASAVLEVLQCATCCQPFVRFTAISLYSLSMWDKTATLPGSLATSFTFPYQLQDFFTIPALPDQLQHG